MYERFTDRARKVMALANQETQRFNHEYIDTPHILLGLVKEGGGVGANVLKNHDVDMKKLRLEVKKFIKPGPDVVTMGKMPQTPQAKDVIKYAIEESRSLNHNYVGTEHILFGLLREPESIAAKILTNLGLKLEDVRQEGLNLLGAGTNEQTKQKDYSDNFSLEAVPLKMLIDPGQATSEELGELFAKLSILYRMMGGSGLDFRAIDVREGVGSYV